MDVAKILKKKYYHILMTIDETTWGRHITTDRNLSSKAKKNIIYENIRLYEMIKSLKDIEIDYSSSELMRLSGDYVKECMYRNY